MVRGTRPPLPDRRATAGSLAAYDDRLFFEKALVYGVQHGILDDARLELLAEKAAQGIVQIARYFGSEYLLAELERARERLVRFVSLALQTSSQGDLHAAAVALREQSLLALSKAGADQLKALITMPKSTHFGMNDDAAFGERHIPLLDKWSSEGWEAIQQEWAQRSQVALTLDTAMWLAGRIGVQPSVLDEAQPDAEAVIRTALLAHAAQCHETPNWPCFEAMIDTLRQSAEWTQSGQCSQCNIAATLRTVPGLPDTMQPVIDRIAHGVCDDLPRILDPHIPVRALFDQTPAFVGRYFWVDDPMGELDHHDRNASSTWYRLTQGTHDDTTLLTMLLCVAAARKPATSLSDRAAQTLVRKIRKTGWHPERATAFLDEHAPPYYRKDCQRLWNDFVQQATQTLCTADSPIRDAMALLRQECAIVG
ncbi:hypothetical protein [Candidatus Symbiobacter mobilis]|uniref:Uncharacterized protein n=1 Tax=Candidatus Symbiobacter mobilis CR TaxID=946483 RepID=U5N8P4_9BURK|nr:hypothetical protein [Candidatus Symbiobacter mobilis]AGX87901.1 hypothetical protein Cenrod_1817 [Candidatus Symbiobacter mobilis CR]